jgi:hypothetical protein
MLQRWLVRYVLFLSVLLAALCSKEEQTTVISIAFDGLYDFPYVSNAPEPLEQIRTLMPQGIAYALQIDDSTVRPLSVHPLETRGILGYTTTVLLCTIPSNEVEKLQAQLRDPRSRAYSNPIRMERRLFSHINNRISLRDSQTHIIRRNAERDQEGFRHVQAVPKDCFITLN